LAFLSSLSAINACGEGEIGLPIQFNRWNIKK
jgi:hypothetical protein